MLARRMVHWTVVFAFLVLILATPKSALAWSGGCGSSYYVHRGDTLWSISNSYGTTVAALRQANPDVGYWIYAGQTLCLPGGYQSGGYDYQSSGYNNGYDNCYSNCYGNSYGNGYGNSYGSGYDNGNGNCYSNCYGNNYGSNYGNSYSNGYDNGYASYGAPNNGDGTYCIQRGDTLRMIAARYGTTVWNLLALNPQIYNPNWIYAGQVIRLW
jgi:LysM repeat protein